MKLTSVDIENFRSIKKETIYFDPAGRILVGINESGKSNLLKALSLLSREINPLKEDIRESLPKESPPSEAFVDFIFELDKIEVEVISKEIFDREILSKSPKLDLIKSGSGKYSLLEFCEFCNKAIYRVDIINGSKSILFFTLDKEFKIIPSWKKHINYNKVVLPKEKTIINCFAVNQEEISDEEKPNFVDITAENIESLIRTEVEKIVQQKLPKTVLWEYKKENDLPPTIIIDDFAANPDTCVPLKNMFYLTGIIDINKAITEARAGSPNQFRNLLEKVAQQTTDYIREIWKDYKTIDFTLDPNGTNIDISVKEKNKYSFYQRSDGFKRFVTFILMISTVVKNKHLSDFLLLIDEPEIHIHPSGIQYLRDELIKISKDGNYVVVSTHSIFLIDPERVKRHYIVKKINEKTNIAEPDEGNLAEEEVIFKAYGFSLYEILNKKNIIFEGWRDKQIFRIAIEHLPKKHKSLKDKFKDIGICHAKGVNHIKNITPLLELGKRECLILSDNDDAAKRGQTDFNKEKIYGIWKRYEEVESSISAITGEDFIKESKVNNAIDSVKIKHLKIAALANPTLSHLKGKMFAIDSWLKQAGINDENDRKEIKNEIKDNIFNSLASKDIETFYFDYLVGISKLI